MTSQDRTRKRARAAARMPHWVLVLLRVPLIGKIAGANALIVVIAAAVAGFGGLISQGSILWLLLLVTLGAGLAVNAILVYIALRPLDELEQAARRVWQGELEARVPGSVVADAGIRRVGNTLNLLLDGLNADRARLRSLAYQVIQAGDKERANIARELHDSTAQTLAALLLELSVMDTENTDARLAPRIARVRAIVSDVLDEVRSLAHTVHPRVLDDLGLAAALQLLARETLTRGSMIVSYSGPGSVDSLDPSTASALYRIAQEAVGNAVRHAQAKTIEIEFAVSDGEAHLRVSDDGVGFVPEEVEKRRPGMGLFTMRERAALVGGRLAVDSEAGHGTKVVASVPVTAEPPAPEDGLALVGPGQPWTRRKAV